MSRLPDLLFDPRDPSSRGRFDAVVTNGEIHLPDIIGQLAQMVRAPNVIRLIVAMDTHPGFFAQKLGWTADEVVAATNFFRDQIQTAFPDLRGIGRPKTPRDVHYGGISSRDVSREDRQR